MSYSEYAAERNALRGQAARQQKAAMRRQAEQAPRLREPGTTKASGNQRLLSTPGSHAGSATWLQVPATISGLRLMSSATALQDALEALAAGRNAFGTRKARCSRWHWSASPATSTTPTRSGSKPPGHRRPPQPRRCTAVPCHYRPPGPRGHPGHVPGMLTGGWDRGGADRG